MKTNYTDKQLQSAIDEAFAKGYKAETHRFFLSPSSFYWDQEAPNRLSLIKSAIASLPEPEPPTVDGKTPEDVMQSVYYSTPADEYPFRKAASAVLAAFGKQSQAAEEANARAEKAEAELARIIEAAHEAGWNGVENPKDLAQFIKYLAEEVGNRQAALLAACTSVDEQKGKADCWYNQAKSENEKYLAAVEEIQLLKTACDRMSEQEVLLLSQLRPLAEAGPVPEGCVRHYTYKKDGEWTTRSKYRAMQDTHYIDIGWRYANEPTPKANKNTSDATITPWTPKVGDVVTLKSGGPKMTITALNKNKDNSGASWFNEGVINSASFDTSTIQPA